MRFQVELDSLPSDGLSVEFVQFLFSNGRTLVTHDSNLAGQPMQPSLKSVGNMTFNLVQL